MLAALVAMAGCGANPARPGGSSQAGPSVSSRENESVSEPESRNDSSEEQSSAAPSTESLDDKGYEISTNGTWEAYVSNRDNYKLHVRKADGSEDRAIFDDIAEFPCLVGDWVYFFPDLCEIDKIRLDGTGREKVCDTDAIDNLNGSMAVTTEYKDGCILYRTQQMRQGGDNSSYPENDYRLDLEQAKITPVEN